jgi:nucleotide-binding universal stress UspA family protein
MESSPDGRDAPSMPPRDEATVPAARLGRRRARPGRWKTILCGVDGSEHAVRAAGLAGTLARALGADLVLANVEPAYHGGQGGLLKEAAERAGLEQARLRPVEASSPTEGLLAAARVEQPQLIVVGARGRSGLRAALLGSVSAELPTSARCPVVVSPPDAAVPPLSGPNGGSASVVCGVDDSEQAKRTCATAGAITAALGAHLTLVHSRLAEPPLPHRAEAIELAYEMLLDREHRQALGVLQRALEWAGLPEGRMDISLQWGDPPGRIEAVAEERSAALVVVGSRGRGPLRAGMLGSTSQALAGSAGRPVVIVPPGADPAAA